MTCKLSCFQFCCILVILFPVPYLTKKPENNLDDPFKTVINIPNKYDVFYVTHGKTQPKMNDNCEACNITNNMDECIANIDSYNCALKLGLQSGIQSFHVYNTKPYPNLSDPNKPSLSVTLPLTNIYAVAFTEEAHNEYSAILGEWELRKGLHNGHGLWTKTDKYNRELKLFFYGQSENQYRWIIGENEHNDGAYIYANVKPEHPVLVSHQWLQYYGNSWVPLNGLRFVMGNDLSPQMESIQPNNGDSITIFEPIVITFTNIIEFGDGNIVIKHNDNVLLTCNGNRNSDINCDACDHVINIEYDELIINLDKIGNNDIITGNVSISLDVNSIHSNPKNENNGLPKMDDIIQYNIINDINYEEISMKYFNHAISLTNNTKDYVLPMMLNALILLDSPDHEEFEYYINELNEILNDVNNDEKDEIYYHRLSQNYLFRAYKFLFTEPIKAIGYIDEALYICHINYRKNIENNGTEYFENIPLISNRNDIPRAGEYYCNFDTYDTYYTLPDGYHANKLPNYFINHYFPKVLRLGTFVDEYTNNFPNELNILFENSGRYKYDTYNLKVINESILPPKYDALLGLQNMDKIRLDFARYGAVQIKNLLSPIECKLLTKYFGDAIKREYPKSIASYDHSLSRAVFNSDRVTFYYLTKLNKLMSKIVGKPVKKAYAFLCGYEVATQKKMPWLLSHVDREDNTYTFSLTIGHSGSNTPPFPIYAHTQRMPQRRKNYPIPAWNETLEFINDIGDAILFKGRQHIHWRNRMPKHKNFKYYWTILFHYVPIEFDFVDFKQRSQRNGDI